MEDSRFADRLALVAFGVVVLRLLMDVSPMDVPPVGDMLLAAGILVLGATVTAQYAAGGDRAAFPVVLAGTLVAALAALLAEPLWMEVGGRDALGDIFSNTLLYLHPGRSTPQGVLLLVALCLPLGAARSARQRWLVVVLAGVAVLPLVHFVLWLPLFNDHLPEAIDTTLMTYTRVRNGLSGTWPPLLLAVPLYRLGRQCSPPGLDEPTAPLSDLLVLGAICSVHLPLVALLYWTRSVTPLDDVGLLCYAVLPVALVVAYWWRLRRSPPVVGRSAA